MQVNDDGTKLCPLCGETIRRVAIKCRFCGEPLAGLQPGDHIVAVNPSIVRSAPTRTAGATLRTLIAMVVLVGVGCVVPQTIQAHSNSVAQRLRSTTSITSTLSIVTASDRYTTVGRSR